MRELTGDLGPGVHLRPGSKVVELSVLGANKGEALASLRQGASADAAVFIGDDVTDEDAFAVLLGPADLAVKVGPGPTRAPHRVADTGEVAEVLAVLAGLRGRRAGPG